MCGLDSTGSAYVRRVSYKEQDIEFSDSIKAYICLKERLWNANQVCYPFPYK